MTDMTVTEREENARDQATAMGLMLCKSLTDETFMLVDEDDGTIDSDGLDLEGVEDRLESLELQKKNRELQELVADLIKGAKFVLEGIDEISAMHPNHPRSAVKMGSLVSFARQDADVLRGILEKARA